MAWVGWSMSHWRFTTVGRCSSTPSLKPCSTACATSQHVGVALADVHVVADADHLRHEGDHVRRLAHRLPVGDLALSLVEVGDGEAQQVAGRGEAEARAGGVVAEL